MQGTFTSRQAAITHAETKGYTVGSNGQATFATKGGHVMTIIDMQDDSAREHFQLCQVIAALRIEVATGLSHSRGSVLKLAKDQYGIHKQTKKGMLTELEKLFETTYGRKYGAPREGT